jgi:hypothetical protein
MLFDLLFVGSLLGATPIEACDVQTRAWCLIRSGVFFDEGTLDNDSRLWTFYGGYLGDKRIRMTESRACSSTFAQDPRRLRDIERVNEVGENQLVVKWRLNAQACEIMFEVPLKDGVRDESVYYFITSSIRACTVSQCPGPSLSRASPE